MSDPFTGEFDLGTLVADDNARVELLRGQQSALHGYDAIGGVIQYITAPAATHPVSARGWMVGRSARSTAPRGWPGVARDLDYACRARSTAPTVPKGSSDDQASTDPLFVPVRVRLRDYVLVNLNDDVALTSRLSLFARVENLAEERYEDVYSFTNPGRAAYAGLRARF